MSIILVKMSDGNLDSTFQLREWTDLSIRNAMTFTTGFVQMVSLEVSMKDPAIFFVEGRLWFSRFKSIFQKT